MEHVRSDVEAAGISARNRAVLALLHTIHGPFTLRDASIATGLSRDKIRRRLAYFAKRGWLTRIARGLYTTVPLDAKEPSDWREDPWVVAEKKFSPCYIGGWSACEHWGLTDQIFRDVMVATTRVVRRSSVVVQNTRFKIRHIPSEALFGTVKVWRRDVSVFVSDPSRTVVDILADPALGGGMTHGAEVLTAYFSSAHRRDDLLIEYADRLRAGAVFKRLGYLIEALGLRAARLLGECRKRRRKGVILLDPSLPGRGPIRTSWNVRANVPSLSERAAVVD